MSLHNLARNDVQDTSKQRLDDMDAPRDARPDVTERRASQDKPKDHTSIFKDVPTGSPNGIRSSPPVTTKDDAMDINSPRSPQDNNTGKSDSEAETIVLPGKDGHSPSKLRKAIKHEDQSDEESTRSPRQRRYSAGGVGETRRNGSQPREPSNATSTLGKRKRQKSGENHANSSGLSSVPTSPIATTRSSLSKPEGSDSDLSRSPSPVAPHSLLRDKARSVDRILPRKKRYDADSGEEDDIEERRNSRKRTSGTKLGARSPKDPRSTSPQARSHQRSISTQLPAKSSTGLSHKKKRVPAPLRSTEYQSDESSASASSFPRSSRLRSLAAPHTGDSAMSPIKTASHKKHVNSSGQTQLQRACASNKSDQLTQVMQRYEERPQDLNESDHAGNTPLHSASINGSVKVVKFLLGTGHCTVDPLNIQKDTPLHDALENRHVEVVKLLLNAGANPRKPKGDGKDPVDIIAEKVEEDEDDEDRMSEWNTMRRLIDAAIKKQPTTRPDSDDERPEHGERGLSHATDSPRHTPPINIGEGSGMQQSTRRVGVGTSRQVKTRDGNLYQPMNLTELRKAARDGDNDTTARILEVMPNISDPMTLWLSARGGHSDTMEFQLAMGNFDPDTGPIKGEEQGKNTPFLVAIGRGSHVNVLKLLLSHGVDPTRLHGPNGDETYYDIARERKGPNWQEEVQLLKEAFDNYKKTHKSSPSKPRSPGLRRDQRDADRERRAIRKEDSSRSHKRSSSDPKPKESSTKSSHRRNSTSVDHSRDRNSVRRGPGRPRKEESTTNTAISDRESSPLAPPKAKSHSRKSESELTHTSDNEAAAKPRRKLVSGKEFRGERELDKQRRPSVVSNASNVSNKEKRERAESKVEKSESRASPSISKTIPKTGERESHFDKHLMEKERARSLKRDDSKDRLSAIRGESPVKRPRKSETPPRSNVSESTANAPKRRKIDSESTRNTDSTPSSSPETQTKQKSTLSRDSSVVRGPNDMDKASRKHTGEATKDSKHPSVQTGHSQNRVAKTLTSDVSGATEKTSKPSATTSGKENSTPNAIPKDDEVKAVHLARDKIEQEAALKKEADDRAETARIEEAKQARLARELAAKEEEARHDQEEAERRVRQQQEDLEARSRAAEAQRVLYMEQERLKREEQERRRVAAQEQARAEKLRLEKIKREEYLAKLPYLLRWLELTDEVKTTSIASLFKNIPGYRYDTIKPEMAGTPEGREQWMLNTHVAVLLGERDLQLSRCKVFENPVRK